MSLNAKKFIIAVLGAAFLASLVFVQWMEVNRRAVEAGRKEEHVAVPASSERCVECHAQESPGIVGHWEGSTHAAKGVGCFECHEAREGDVDGWAHEGYHIATVVTPMDCARCHPAESAEFEASHHSKAGRILHSLDNRLAEVVEGHRGGFNPHAPAPGREDEFGSINGIASAASGCQQCHGSKVALVGKDGTKISMDELQPDENGHPTNAAAVANIARDADGKPQFHASTWPNTGIGRFNLDGSAGSCTACHSRHRLLAAGVRVSQENCGTVPPRPGPPAEGGLRGVQSTASPYRDLVDRDEPRFGLVGPRRGLRRRADLRLPATCPATSATAAASPTTRASASPGPTVRRFRWSWTPASITGSSRLPTRRSAPRSWPTAGDTWMQKRERMKQACHTCHSKSYVNGFYQQYDDLVTLYNQKFAVPGAKIMSALREHNVRTAAQFDEEIEVHLVLPLAP